MKKKGIVITSIIVLVLIVSITCVFGYISSRDKTRKEVREFLDNDKITKQCKPFTGGSYTLKFDTDGGTEIEDMNVCIACSPDSYKDIPIPEKEGYTFEGWYTDKEFTNMVSITNIRDFEPVPKYDKNKCKIGYQDITIHAKWSKIQLRLEEENNNTVNSQPRSGGVPSGGNNGQPAQETVPDYPLPPAHTTKVYRPINAGTLRGLYGRIENNSIQYDLLFNKAFDSDRFLYPINDGYVIKFFRNSYYNEIIYKTNIDGKEYFVRYYSYNTMSPARDYSDENNKIVSYNNPIAISPSGIFRMQMFNADSGNPYVFNNNNLINPNLFLKLNKDEEFYER